MSQPIPSIFERSLPSVFRRQVFADPSRTRWRGLRRMIAISILLVFMVLVDMIASFAVSPILPPLPLPTGGSSLQAGRESSFSSTVLPDDTTIHYDGKGQILKVTSAIPPYSINRFGSDDSKKIALTFNDGPNPLITNQILRILREEKVRATFFIVGEKALYNPNLVNAVYREGHEVGNHTFSHPDTTLVSSSQLRWELNATQRLIEAQTGHRSLLVRMPFSTDKDPTTVNQLGAVLFADELGYYTVASGLDPLIWRGAEAQAIAKATVDKVIKEEVRVIQLHENGEGSDIVLEALPAIIRGLRAQGYDFVPASGLIGVERSVVMPPLAIDQQVIADINKLAFAMISNFSLLMRVLFTICIGLGLAKLVLSGYLALHHQIKRRRWRFASDYWPGVNVVIPAYNEERHIIRTVASVLNSTYPYLIVTVVDDGSTDNTYTNVKEYFAGDPRVQLFYKENGGRAEAINYGSQQVEADIVVTVDADTMVYPDAITNLVRHFWHSEVGAVLGNTRVGNRGSLFTRWQALEYVTGPNLDKQAFDALNFVSLLPDSFSAWRRDILVHLGGFPQDTWAEDTDLSLMLINNGYTIRYEDSALALTEAPPSLEDFLVQRFRWSFGALQAFWKHRHGMVRSRLGRFSGIFFSILLFFQLLFPLVSPVIDLLLAFSVLEFGWQLYHHPSTASAAGLTEVASLYGIFLAIDFVISFIAFLTQKREQKSLLIWLPLQRVVYRQLLYVIFLRSVFTALRGERVEAAHLHPSQPSYSSR